MDNPPSKYSSINLTIQAHPFNSPESALLITELDKELSVMYPDWISLPHPGEDIGLARETVNPKPKLEPLAALDIKSESDTVVATPAAATTAAAAAPSILEQAVTDDGEGLHFFIAFASTSTCTSDGQIDDSATHDDDSNGKKKKDIKGEPVGCIALRLSPYFPFHHPSSAYIADRQISVEDQIQRQQRSGIKTAQLKRMYVVPTYRSRRVMDPSVATRLVEYVERYAKEQMGVQRLVLETGIRQLAAIRLYERRGWKARECFGDYVSSRTEVGGVSVCYELML